MDKKINSFQALRGIAALLIIAEHVSFLRCGIFGVDIFFVLSGFMIMYSTKDGMDYFLLKRLIRIVPFYWLVTLVTFVGVNVVPQAFNSTRGGIRELLYSMFFIPFDMVNGTAFTTAVGMPVIQPLMRIGWTLNLEMLFYVLFFLAAKISHKLRALIATVFIFAMIILGAFVPYPAFILWGGTITLEFVFGMLLFYICMFLGQKNIPKWCSYISAVLGTVIVITFIFMKRYEACLGSERVLVWGIPAAVLVLCAYLYDINLQSPKGLVMVGNISFSIYYVHYYIIQIYNRLILQINANAFFEWAILFVVLLFIILISYGTWMLIERKFTGFLKRALIK